MVSFWGAFWPPRWLKPVLVFSWSGQEPFHTLFFRPRRPPRAVQEASKSTSRGLQELRRLQAASKRPLGSDFTSPGPLLDLKKTRFLTQKPFFWHEFSVLPRSPQGLPGALQKTSKSISRYSETSLLCQEFSKIFQDKPPRASLLERKPRSLQERIPRRARASLKGVGGGASP